MRTIKTFLEFSHDGHLLNTNMSISKFLVGPLPHTTPLLAAQGRYDEADPLYLRAIEIGERTLGPDHPDLAKWLNNRAGLLESQVRVNKLSWNCRRVHIFR